MGKMGAMPWQRLKTRKAAIVLIQSPSVGRHAFVFLAVIGIVLAAQPDPRIKTKVFACLTQHVSQHLCIHPSMITYMYRVYHLQFSMCIISCHKPCFSYLCFTEDEPGF